MKQGKNLHLGSIEVGDTSTTITKDGGDNLVFTDAVTGAKTLAEIIAGGGGSPDWQTSVLDRYDPTSGLPGTPSVGDRYIATATANTWTADNIYECTDDSTWTGQEETVAAEGMAVYVDDENLYYMFTTSWVKFSSVVEHNSLSALDTGDYRHLTATDKTDLTDSGDSTLHYHATDRNRSNHTGTQTVSTISDFDTEVASNTDVAANTTHSSSDGTDHANVVLNDTHRGSDGKDHADVVTNNAKVTNATHTGDVTGDTTLTIANNAVSNAKAADMSQDTIKGRITAGTGSPTDLTAANVRSIINVEDGAEVNNISDTNATDLTDAGDSTLHYHGTDRARANHTGTQTVSTISDFDTEVASNTDVAANTTHRGSDGTDHANVVLNDTHRASDGSDHSDVVSNTTHSSSDGTDHANVVLNDTHRASDGKNHADVVLNNTHRASDGKDHSDVVLNNTHRGSDGKNHADVVLNNTHRASDGKNHADVVLNNTHRAATDNPHSVDIDQVTPTTTKGDIIVEDGSNAIRIGIGSNNQVLMADSAEDSGVKWAGIPGGVSTFLELTDVPSSYTTAGALYAVNAGVDGVSETTATLTLASNEFKLQNGTTELYLTDDLTVSAACTIDQNLETTANVEFGSVVIDGSTAAGIALEPYGTGVGETTELRFYEIAAGGTNYTGFKCPGALDANVMYTLPDADGDNGQLLRTDGDGGLYWTDDNSGITTFLQLDDTPSAFTTAYGLYSVNSAGDGVEETTVTLVPSTNAFKIQQGTTELYLTADLTVSAECTINQDLSSSSAVSFLYVSTNWFRASSGTKTLPSYAFTAAEDTGLFLQGSSSVGVTADGEHMVTFQQGGGYVQTVLHPIGDVTGAIVFRELAVNGQNGIRLTAPDSVSVDVAFILPGADGDSGQSLITDGSGQWGWADNVSAHNNLSDHDGGTSGEYYHLTSAQHTDLTDGNTSTAHYHAADRARAVHTGTQAASTISDFDTEVGNHTDVAANTTARHTHSNKTVLDNTTASFLTADETKLDGIEAAAEVNNISDTNATDLTDAGESTLHYHDADRDRANHTGNQTSSTISDFSTAVNNLITTNAPTIIEESVLSKTPVTESGTSFTVDAADQNETIITTSGSAVTVTINSGVIGNRFDVAQYGAGTVTFVAGTATIRSKDSNLSIGGQYGAVTGVFVTASEVLLIGDLA